ncbi:YwiC-like family protein [Desulforamulus putei]|uniref:YwiC-like family protein n=1 Tax=Desulforamulus putei TaxID=74701 RepID=UPI002FDEDDD6
MTVILPKEHGVWAMLVVPFVLGAASQGLNWLQVPLLLGWLLLYLTSYPLMMICRNYRNAAKYRKWLIIYGLMAAAFLIVPITRYPALLWLGAALFIILLVNLYYARMNRERELLNNFTAVAGLSLGAVAGGYVGAGSWSNDLLWVWLFCVVFFMGSVFFVKSMIRERTNPHFRRLSWGYHGAVVFFTFIITGSWMLTLAYLPSLVRAIYCTGREMTPLQIGKLEIANSLFFVILAIGYFN